MTALKVSLSSATVSFAVLTVNVAAVCFDAKARLFVVVRSTPTRSE